MIQLDFGDHRPLYEQIKEKLKELIIMEVLVQDDKIPSVRDLAASLAINPNTIQKAYKDLENEGYIYSLKSKGSFVAARQNAPINPRIPELTESINSSARELKFLGVGKEYLFGMINNIYEEGK